VTFTLDMLPAGHGDALWLEYGDRDRRNRILVDGGTGPTYDVLRSRIVALPPDDRRFELLVITHIDAYHIEGVIRLLQDARLGLRIDDVWFNGWQHLPGDVFAPTHGEMLSALLVDLDQRWNGAFDGGAVSVADDDGPLPVVELDGGLRLTVLGPGTPELATLQLVWEREVREAGLVPGSPRPALDLLYKTPRLQIPEYGVESLDVESLAASEDPLDQSEANSSSILLMAEFEGRSVLLGADGIGPILTAGIGRLLRERAEDVLTVDAVKVAHHGSRRNVLDNHVSLVRSGRYLFSTNGAYYHHPDQQAVARILVGDHGDHRSLLFNYRTEESEVWDDPELMERWRYRAVYPDPVPAGLRVDLETER
jgi:hypothetical protein